MSWVILLNWIETHPGLASWVQAAGSILAIIAAIWLSGGERRHQARIGRAARADAIDRSVLVAQHARKIAENTLEFFTCQSIPRSIIPRYLAVIDQASKYVAEVSVSSSIDSQISESLSEVRNALIDTRSLVAAWADNLDNDYSHDIDFFRANIMRIIMAIHNLTNMKYASARRFRIYRSSAQ